MHDYPLISEYKGVRIFGIVGALSLFSRCISTFAECRISMDSVPFGNGQTTTLKDVLSRGSGRSGLLKDTANGFSPKVSPYSSAVCTSSTPFTLMPSRISSAISCREKKMVKIQVHCTELGAGAKNI
jgi:hypothetical protein